MMNIISYLICSLLMFFIGNIQNWLKPYLINEKYPEWLYNSFPFYGIIYVAAGLLSTFIAQKLKPKTNDEKELLLLRKGSKNFEKTKYRSIKSAVSEQNKLHQNEISKIKENHKKHLKSQMEAYQEEITKHQFTIKAKDQLISLMTAQLAEKFKIIENYNKETSINSNKPNQQINNVIGDFMPDIGDYS
ncbi:hypothetical protein ACI51Z_01865 [Pectobacterium carotovorum]|uniref:hypothetical protein n=1 Tax=Pectobacterium carotovorum TaxID=554 RepID=UPI0038685C14